MQAAVSKLAVVPALIPGRKFVWQLIMLLLTSGLAAGLQAQSLEDFNIEVQVANQSDRERNSAYRLAFDRVLLRQVETRVRVEPEQRSELMVDPSLYVQSFRYRGFLQGADNALLATTTVRESGVPAAVIIVSFPTDLAAIIQRQLIPVVEEPAAPVIAPVIALVAVEQQDKQFIIGGDRGRKFQQRATELASANNLQLEFPNITVEDLESISAADIFNSDVERINNFSTRYAGSELLTGALYRLSPTTWQSDWTYTGQDQQARSFSLSTGTLDEALVAAITQISPGGGFLSNTYDDVSADRLEQTGVAIRVENIRSLSDYDNILATLRQLDADIVTESLELNSMVFRATEQSAQRVRNSLLASNSFEPIDADQISGELSFRYLAR